MLVDECTIYLGRYMYHAPKCYQNFCSHVDKDSNIKAALKSQYNAKIKRIRDISMFYEYHLVFKTPEGLLEFTMEWS